MLSRARRSLLRAGFAAVAASACVVPVTLAPAARAQVASAESGTTIARWIQLAPGSSFAALKSGSWGDKPLAVLPTILARTIVTGGACPVARLDHFFPLTLHKRFDGAALVNVPGTPGSTNGKSGYPQYFVQNTVPQNFPNGTPMATTSWTECEAVVPYGFGEATVDGVDLKLPSLFPNRILVMADTGCRMNGASSQQNCASPTAFPFAYLANYEASFKPDLVVQVGDWFYRDTNCSNVYPGCNDPTSPAYETWGDTFDSWNADVFFPAKPLLAAAPWIMVRGNHESCGRGARGWYALLDPFPYDASKVACAPSTPTAPAGATPDYTADFEPSYTVAAGGVNFIVHDSSLANDSKVVSALAQNYDVDLSNALAFVGPKSINIFTTHKPSFGLTYGATGTPAAPADNSGDFTEQAVFSGGTYAASAFTNGVPANIGLFLSGHIHQFEYVNFTDFSHYAPQLIVGIGGTLLDPDINTGLVPSGITDPAAFTQTDAPFTVNQFSGAATTTNASKTYAHDEFGFALLTTRRDKLGAVTGFDAAVYKISSALAGHCRIALRPARSIRCDF